MDIPAEPAHPARSFTPDDLYRIGAQLLGLFAVMRAVAPLAYTIAELCYMKWGGTDVSYDLANLIQLLLYLGFGLFLIARSRWIAHWLARLRYDPERGR